MTIYTCIPPMVLLLPLLFYMYLLLRFRCQIWQVSWIFGGILRFLLSLLRGLIVTVALQMSNNNSLYIAQVVYFLRVLQYSYANSISIFNFYHISVPIFICQYNLFWSPCIKHFPMGFSTFIYTEFEYNLEQRLYQSTCNQTCSVK